MVPAVPPPMSGQGPQGRRHGFGAYIHNIRQAVTSTFEGLTVTMSWMFRRPSTVQYPDRTDKPVQEMLPENYRGVLEVDLDRCTACMLCQKSCPLGCISIETCKHPEGGREMSKFDIDIGLCMYCGLCAEACNFDALVHTNEFEAAVDNAEKLVLHFVDKPRPVVKAKAPEMPPRQPRGAILKALIPGFGKRQPGTMPEPQPRPAPPPAPEQPDKKPEGDA